MRDNKTPSWDSKNATSWLELCNKACESDEVFNIFRSGYPTTAVCEFTMPSLGESYIEVIKETAPEGIAKNLDKFKIGDSLGSPQTFTFPEIGNFAPTTLSYIKHLVGFINEFGSLDSFDIVEIGPAYGGQCLIIAQQFKFKSYHLIDFGPVVSLAKKYLETHGVKNISTTSASKVSGIKKTKKYDLLISNSAFAENSKEAQDIYIEKIVKHCKRGYLVYNTAHFSEEDLRQPEMPYSAEDMIGKLRKYFDIRVSYDIPTPLNQPILTWG